jgi:uncharacterized membrane protein YozB (DUF420 family)
MNPKLLFWSWALANMGLVLGLGLRGWLAIHANQIDRHRRSMVWAGFWVVAFLAAYLVKSALLGREDLSVWSSFARTNLFVHEAFVGLMLLAGGFALSLGRRLARTRRVTERGDDPPATPEALARHRLAGRVALIGALFGFITACGILGGMAVRG